MEGSGISRLDCYEDMFKEITRKLYGEDPDHRTSSVQNEFETSVSYKNDEDTENGIDGSDDGNWTCEEEPLKGTDGSRIASYHAGKAIWRCLECGDISGSPRETAEHFMENHLRVTDDGRNRHHSLRKDYVDLKIEDINLYLEKLRERAERSAPPSCRTQETQTIPQTLLQNSLLEMPSTSGQHLQNANMAVPPTTSTNTKRYNCDICAYGTDRHDLYTRHKNIHCENKPYQCYLCCKPFNRADHVKKHFTRIHREHTYDVSRIRTSQMNAISKQSTSHMQQESAAAQTANANVNNQQQHANYQSAFVGNKTYQLQPNAGSGTATGSIYHTTNMAAPVTLQQVTASCTTGRRVQNGGCNSKSHVKSGSKNTQDKRYTCDYCSWTGGDNWCLKRHMNTHTRPFPCSMCEYKAARAERLSTHVQKVHNRKICTKCSFLTEDQSQLDLHQKQVHGTGNGSAPSTSTVQTALPPPSNNRHPGTFSQVAVGRPPPGPPVFPANPTIASTSAASMITPSTILGFINALVNDS